MISPSPFLDIFRLAENISRTAASTNAVKGSIANTTLSSRLEAVTDHIGIPTTERREDERLIEHYATFVSGYETSAYGIEWMRFGPEAPVPELVRTVPHVAFEVEISPLKSPEKRYSLRPTHPHRV